MSSGTAPGTFHWPLEDTMAERYTPDEVAAQVATVETLRRDESLSYRQIAEQTGLPLATVHRRAAAVATLADAQDATRAVELRHEATMDVRAWMGRLEDATHLPPEDADRISLVQAFPLNLKAWELLLRANGGNMPLRVALQDDRRPGDPELRAALEREARAAENADAEDTARALADEGGR